MDHYPDFATFSALADAAPLVPIYRRLIADSLTPVSAFHLLDEGSCACLFESVVGGEKVGRYSFLTANPFMSFEAHGNRVTITKGSTVEEFQSADPLADLKSRIDQLRAVRLPELPPFTSGAIGYAGYDVIRYT
ncbi:MAG: anthranilate synthase component I, partial [Planctomycetota bacterium]|nr:anthranilate synthase component I [Planctomycetota bacterium]